MDVKRLVEKVEYSRRNGLHVCFVTLYNGWVCTGESIDRTVAYHVALHEAERFEQYRQHCEFWEPVGEL